MTYSCTQIQATVCKLWATEQHAMPSEQRCCLMLRILH